MPRYCKMLYDCCMKNVEQHNGFQWGEPLGRDGQLQVERVGEELRVRALFPRYQRADEPSDLIRQHELARKNRSIGKQSTAKDSPHVQFANADTDEKLIAFVRRFGPVVARSVSFVRHDPRLVLQAIQDLKELRTERMIYQAVVSLTVQSRAKNFDVDSATRLIETIASNIRNWPEQLTREQSERAGEPSWKLSQSSMQRISQLSSHGPEAVLPPVLPPNLDARIVISELLNVFPGKVFPNRLEMHSAIKHGIRPLLYAILRREFLYPHGTEVCANTFCRDFFEVERANGIFCSPECSRQQRQRDYWQERGNKLRRQRLRKGRMKNRK
jgi:hypothetical protein